MFFGKPKSREVGNSPCLLDGVMHDRKVFSCRGNRTATSSLLQIICNLRIYALHLRFSHSYSGAVDRRQSFIDEIEKLVLKIENDLINGSKLTIAVPYRVSWTNCFVNEER